MTKPVVLHVLHPWGGGTDKHVHELCRVLGDSTISLIVTPLPNNQIWLRSANSKSGIDFKRPAEELLQLTKSLGVSLVHIHQLIGHTTNFQWLISELNVPFYLTVHDYTLVCPQINFVTSAGVYCNESTDTATFNTCLKGGCQFGVTDIDRWRNSFAWAITDAAKVICPSQDVVSRCKKYILDANYIVVPHENSISNNVTALSVTDRPLKVAVLGRITYIKGNQVLANLVDLARQQKQAIEFTVIGQIIGMSTFQTDAYFKQTGLYDDDDLLDIIDANEPDVILFPAIWPETYSYTLTAAMASGKPIVAPNFGSFPERLNNREWTWLFDHNMTVADLFNLLVTLKDKPLAVSSVTASNEIDFYTNGYLNNIERRFMDKNTVLITSAIHTNYGIYNKQERVLQTLDTIESVRKYIPNAVIILLDASTVAVQEDTSAEFEKLIDNVDYYIDYSDDLDFQHFHNNITNYDIGKNAMESLAMLKTLKYITEDAELMNIITTSSRIFKLSGRYQITDKFDIAKFDNEKTKDKYVFKIRTANWIPNKDTGVDHQLYTRLWSFTPGLFQTTIDIYQQLLKNMFDTFNQGKYIDIEHSMAKFIPKDQLIELSTIGLKGNIAPNGVEVID